MPKRSYDTKNLMLTDQNAPPVKVQKTERSHEENQERAYIAASRRADRSLEARVQSARMASDIHQKRTGRRLKVSPEIVLKEEMYEEMEDDIPRPYKYLTADLQTDSAELNHRVGAYLASKSAMATVAKYNEVNKIFEEAFPYSQQLSHSIYVSPLINNPPLAAPRSGSVSCHSSRNHSISASSQCSDTANSISKFSPCHTPATACTLTPNPSPTATSTETTDQPGTPYQMPHPACSNFPLDPELVQPPAPSFTSRLPNEVRLMANIDMNDPMAMYFLGEQMSQGQLGYVGGAPLLNPPDPGQLDSQGKALTEHNETLMPSLNASIDAHLQDEFLNDSICQFSTPACGSGVDGWESYVDFDTER
ncbi:hypothetical protein F4861DRAFT_388753 [Xylaria intraflava]|nr:hypothetical protein F4861DRAFT_388753 [Xylaria intraflava]